MIKTKRNNAIKVSVFFVGVVILAFVVLGQEYFAFEGNNVKFSLTQLALIQDHSAMDCDAYNVLYVTYKTGQKSKIAEQREGAVQPFIDSTKLNQLSLAIGGNTVDKTHIVLELECNGDAMDGTTVVSGDVRLRLSVEGGKTHYLVGYGQDASHSTIASQFQTFSFSPTQLEDSKRKQVYEKIISASQIESALGSTDQGLNLFYKSEMYPKLTFSFIHPTAGQFTGGVDLLTENKKIVAQFGNLIRTTGTTDTDGDGIDDTVDQCPNDPETINGYLDTDGCPDTNPADDNDSTTDTDGDGITNDKDQCDTQPETFNGFEDEDGCPDTLGKGLRINSYSPQIYDVLDNNQVVNISIGIENYLTGDATPVLESFEVAGAKVEGFSLPGICTKTGNGWVDCSFSITLDLQKYEVGSHEFQLSSTDRGTISAPFEIIDSTPINNEPDPDPEQNDPIDTVENTVEEIRDFFIEPSTATPIEITDEDLLIIAALVAGAIGLLVAVKLAKKKKK